MSLLNQKEYSFLKEDERFTNKRLALLTYGGSHAYGTNNKGSDIDLRGIYLPTKQEILSMTYEEKPFTDKITDTVIYPLKQIVELLCNCNPNTIEILGTREEDIFAINDIGKILRENAYVFLSQKAYDSFNGYAVSQLRRLQNAIARDSLAQPDKEEHILQSIKRRMDTFEISYKDICDGELNLYIDDTDREGYDKEIYIDINLKNYPLRDLRSMLGEMNETIKQYGKLNHRNNKKDEPHLYKHAMHLIRLMMMGIDILEGKGINTYRKEKDFLLDIRHGKYSFDEIFEITNEYDRKFREAKNHTDLPKYVDMNKVNELIAEINLQIVNG